MESALYFGTLRHRRFRPVAHQFRYGLFMAFLDIDRIPEVMSRSWFSSYQRFNWAAFWEGDHCGDPRRSLRERLTEEAAKHGIKLPSGQIFLLTHLRYLGYNFNPISLFYCFAEDGETPVVLAEVNNTFGERHNYWLSEANRMRSGRAQRFRCPKAMHVSPFMGMEMEYEFVFSNPGDRLLAHMKTLDGGDSIFDATLSLERRPWTSRELLRGLLRHPWMTAKVIAAIHWEALRLYWKGAPVYTHPAKLHARREAVSKDA